MLPDEERGTGSGRGGTSSGRGGGFVAFANVGVPRRTRSPAACGVVEEQLERPTLNAKKNTRAPATAAGILCIRMVEAERSSTGGFRVAA